MADAVLDGRLSEWIAGQRWYAGKGTTPRLAEAGRWGVADGDVEVTVLLVSDASGALYQVPLVRRGTPAEKRAPILEDADGLLYDGVTDPAFVDALLTLVSSGGRLDGWGASAIGEPVPGTAPLTARSAKVLSGEQSNTSIIADTDAGPVIVKVFRTLHPGDNPDVVLQSAIAQGGSSRVPRSIGAVRGEWGDGSAGHLAFAQEFLPGTEDAWRVATAAVDAGEDFADRARALGDATAEVHGILAGSMETAAADESRKARLLDSFRARLAAAAQVVAGLDVAGVEAVYRAAAAERWPTLQRVHGDYHLGQVLLVPDRGWVLLDFEGEPLRPMDERNEPDLALRDVAGMLRSFDYAAGASRQARPGDPIHAAATRNWADGARDAFLDGYEARAGRIGSRRLLAALELDKALYEAVYEARNRPDWLPIPTEAIRRLVSLSV
ncbi:MAG TPA: aminoglycoside phosphotransferase [Naasia sp.]|jgi:predicted trehalose synthase